MRALPPRAQAFSRAELERLEALAKEWGAKGLAYLVFGRGRRGALADREVPLGRGARAFRREPGSTVLFGADEPAVVARVSERCASTSAASSGSSTRTPGSWLWITDFPMFEWSEEDGRWAARPPSVHAADAEFEASFDEDPGRALAFAYDLVGNGRSSAAARSGSTSPSSRRRSSTLLQLSPEEQRRQFGFLLDALAMGAPPHGGIAFGIDRMMMVLAREPNLAT